LLGMGYAHKSAAIEPEAAN